MTPGAGPDGGDALARAFEVHRPRLVRVAYATVGSVAEAEDCVQEAWLRLRRAGDPAEIRDLGAWLTTTVSRLALDALGPGAPGALCRSLAARAAGRGHSRRGSRRPGHAR